MQGSNGEDLGVYLPLLCPVCWLHRADGWIVSLINMWCWVGRSRGWDFGWVNVWWQRGHWWDGQAQSSFGVWGRRDAGWSKIYSHWWLCMCLKRRKADKKAKDIIYSYIYYLIYEIIFTPNTFFFLKWISSIISSLVSPLQSTCERLWKQGNTLWAGFNLNNKLSLMLKYEHVYY